MVPHPTEMLLPTGREANGKEAPFKWILTVLLPSPTCHLFRPRYLLIMWSQPLYSEPDRNGEQTSPTVTYNYFHD